MSPISDAADRPATVQTPPIFAVQNLMRSELDALEAYTPIVPFEVLSERLGLPIEQIIKLDANENPYGPAPAVLEALAEYRFYHIYPDPQQTELRNALAAYVGVPADHILPSHGADEMLDYLCRIFLRPGDAVIDCPPTFGMYSFDAQLAGAEVIEIWRRPDYGVDVEAVERAVLEYAPGRVKLLFLTSPNNPSGTWLPDDDLARLLRLPVMVALDEAYVEFADHPSRASWVLRHDNLVVLRTFSKAAGIAGLRLGYGVCPGWLMETLWKFKQPYNVNVAATVAGLASLRNLDYLRATVEKLKAERRRLTALLETISYLRPQPSQANFVLCRVVGRNAKEIKQTLERQGILVRHYNKPGLDNCIRISIGRPEQTDRLVEALREIDAARL
ncbi:MAG: histidinol-phosphate transaminase [Caldilinea sp.]|nr:histidinol-phosphate transaminase [Caldilinea sp.]MDW8440224.1 histidinol-phosphate transaminase [Caldilineaceae bacterium]